jgi:hypothetical protein
MHTSRAGRLSRYGKARRIDQRRREGRGAVAVCACGVAVVMLDLTESVSAIA